MFSTGVMRPLPPAVADRLVRICGLLGSDHAGEAASAAAAATKIIRSAGLTWSELLAPIVTPPAPSARPRHRHAPHCGPGDWRAAAAACLQRPGLFSEWEHNFLYSVLGFRRLSPKQEAILARLVERVRAAGGAP
jgi:hypothetical protein